ncbi:hypothetical protein PIB30_041145 [Stylosanthes scabra]|uniref:Uncharacterized protein n=1 Tax=Stylosanthes scabra TaxID=79078 RepID=A0ABU6SFJ0_9FABA|nr:hypothetical protein [Stylosanthes scabra]
MGNGVSIGNVKYGGRCKAIWTARKVLSPSPHMPPHSRSGNNKWLSSADTVTQPSFANVVSTNHLPLCFIIQVHSPRLGHRTILNPSNSSVMMIGPSSDVPLFIGWNFSTNPKILLVLSLFIDRTSQSTLFSVNTSNVTALIP